MCVDRQGNRQETVGAVQALCARLLGFALAGALAGATPVALRAQLVHGTVSSAIAAGRVPGAVVLLLDSSLTTRARALTSDSGTFTIGDYHSFGGGPESFTLTIVDPPGGPVTTPEPASLILLGLGSLALGAFRRPKTS